MGLLLVLGLTGLLLVAATAAAQDNLPVYGDYGVLDLVLEDGNDAFEFTPAGEALPTHFEQLSAGNQCSLNEDGPHDLVELSVTGEFGQGGNLPQAGLKDHLVGVRAKGEGTGTPCVRIDIAVPDPDAQTFSIELGEFFGTDVFASYAQFALKFKFGAAAKVEAFNTHALDPGAVVAFGTAACTGSDCGPDSGGDRLLITVGDPLAEDPPDLFDKVVISVTSPADGAVSLLDAPNDPALAGEGETLDTFFNLVQEFDGELECGDVITAVDGDVKGTVIRTGDPDNTGECGEIKPYNFDADAGTSQIAFLPQGSPGAEYVASLEFGISHTISNPVTVQYDPTGGTSFQALQACDTPAGSLSSSVSAALTTLGFDVSLLTGKDLAVPAGETWCEIGRTTYSVGSGLYEDVIWTYGNDDPRWGAI
jgi:hypothetical protein